MPRNSVTGPEILEFLRKHGLSQADLAEVCGIRIDRIRLYLLEHAKMDVVDVVKLRAGMRTIERKGS